jgi:hypothetical protein
MKWQSLTLLSENGDLERTRRDEGAVSAMLEDQEA